MKHIIFLTLLSLPLSAQDFEFNKETGKAVPQFVGELKLLRGSAMKTTGGRPRSVKTGDRFYPKDIIATEKDSSMKILISDDTWLSLGPESELVFRDFQYRDKDDRSITYELVKGQLAASVRQKIKNGSVDFRTKYSSFGVRGTKIMMNYRDVRGVPVSEYAVVEGKGEVTDSQGKGHELKAGQRIVLIEDSKKNLERLELSPTDLEIFSSPEANEEKDIRPFMPYYEPIPVTTTSSNTIQEKVDRRNGSAGRGGGTFDNLKKLNEQLKANQKKKR